MKFNEFKSRIRLCLHCLYPICFKTLKKLHIASTEDTIRHIQNTKCSVCRFGDGEFNLIQGRGNGFQSYNKELARRLSEILKLGSSSNIIVCVPYAFINADRLLAYPRQFWHFYVVRHYFFIIKNLAFNNSYFDSLMTRFYIDYADKKYSVTQIQELKKIWEGRNIVIVEGEKTRSGIGNDLFSKSLSIKRIICPSENAYSCYDRILDSVIHNSDKSDLILISLGMTATVLAFDLSKFGYQAIDLGHLDIEYEWFRGGMSNKTSIKGKYVNEVMQGNDVAPCKCVSYHKSIVDIVK